MTDCEASRCEARAEVREDGLDLCRYHATHCDCGRPLDDPQWWECSACRGIAAPGLVGSGTAFPIPSTSTVGPQPSGVKGAE